jgi:heme-degrading monooxygenase HmoA
MYARVWRLVLLPEKVEQFAAACRSVGIMNRKRPGFRGLTVLRGGLRDSPDSTVVSLWESLEDLRASESQAFQKAVARALTCCREGGQLREEEVLVCEVPGGKARASAKKARRPKRRSS